MTLVLVSGLGGAEPATEVEPLVKACTALGFDLFGQLRAPEKNVCISPYSISTALGMTYAGARRRTAQQMATVLHIEEMGQGVHPLFAAQRARLATLNASADVELSIANSLWPQKGYPLREEFLTCLTRNYGAAPIPLDYLGAPEKARRTINAWVSERTRSMIPEMIPPDLIDELTCLVLVNAVYFNGAWQTPFEVRATRDAPFFCADGTTVSVPTMRLGHTSFRYADLGTHRLLELPYRDGELAMLLILPTAKQGLAQIEAALTPLALQEWIAAMKPAHVDLFLPRFAFDSSYGLNAPLQALGMRDAFMFGTADFSGMADTRELFIDAVLHKTRIAAGGAMPAPAELFRADHPFLFLIRDVRSGAILFMGHVADLKRNAE
jgi:serpin B